MVSSIVLPEPEGAREVTSSPRPTRRSRSSSAVSGPQRLAAAASSTVLMRAALRATAAEAAAHGRGTALRLVRNGPTLRRAI